jgi:N-acylneuraminate cytidylyltransferase
VVVSTDDEEIAAVAADAGADVPFLRPPALATDSAATDPAVLDVVDRLEATGERYDVVILLQPTSPVRRRSAVDEAIDQFETSGADSLVSVVEIHPFIWSRTDDGWGSASYDVASRPLRQDIDDGERRYVENGSIYFTRIEAFREAGHRLAGSTTLFEMTREESVDIDTESDLLVVDAILRRVGGLT